MTILLAQPSGVTALTFFNAGASQGGNPPSYPKGDSIWKMLDWSYNAPAGNTLHGCALMGSDLAWNGGNKTGLFVPKPSTQQAGYNPNATGLTTCLQQVDGFMGVYMDTVDIAKSPGTHSTPPATKDTTFSLWPQFDFLTGTEPVLFPTLTSPNLATTHDFSIPSFVGQPYIKPALMLIDLTTKTKFSISIKVLNTGLNSVIGYTHVSNSDVYDLSIPLGFDTKATVLGNVSYSPGEFLTTVTGQTSQAGWGTTANPVFKTFAYTITPGQLLAMINAVNQVEGSTVLSPTLSNYIFVQFHVNSEITYNGVDGEALGYVMRNYVTQTNTASAPFGGAGRNTVSAKADLTTIPYVPPKYRPSVQVMSIPTASASGPVGKPSAVYWGRYPTGNAPTQGIVVSGAASDHVSGAAALSTAIKLAAGATDVTTATGDLTTSAAGVPAAPPDLSLYLQARTSFNPAAGNGSGFPNPQAPNSNTLVVFAASGATSYEFQRSDDNGSTWHALPGGIGTSRIYQDVNAPLSANGTLGPNNSASPNQFFGGTTYLYRARGINSNGNGPWSPTQSAYIYLGTEDSNGPGGTPAYLQCPANFNSNVILTPNDTSSGPVGSEFALLIQQTGGSYWLPTMSGCYNQWNLWGGAFSRLKFDWKPITGGAGMVLQFHRVSTQAGGDTTIGPANLDITPYRVGGGAIQNGQWNSFDIPYSAMLLPDAGSPGGVAQKSLYKVTYAGNGTSACTYAFNRIRYAP